MLYPSHYYHLYNHANGSEDLFPEERNYYFFLEKANKYITPFMNVYAYCLMPNHFHMLVKIKEEEVLFNICGQSQSFSQMNEMQKIEFVYHKISKSLSNLFSSYTQSFNKLYQRKGSLFMPNFKTNSIEDDLSFCAITHYIHANPVHHGFVKDITEWKFSSFTSLCSQATTKLERDYVMEMFGGLRAFREYHSKPIDRKYKWYD
ncbi:MAG: transposase [Bacteroidota bacterium]